MSYTTGTSHFREYEGDSLLEVSNFSSLTLIKSFVPKRQKKMCKK